MSKDTKIQWCDSTFNPWIGCTKVSPGCVNCYAEVSTRARVLRAGGVETWGPNGTRQRTKTWDQPRAWDRAGQRLINAGQPYRRRRIFCASTADWLDDAVPVEWLVDLLDLIRTTPHLDWLLLTKRPENWRPRLTAAFESLADGRKMPLFSWLALWLGSSLCPATVWIGTTVEDQARANARREALRAIPARVHFVSYEPALELVDWTGWEFIDWLIMGGESGAKARPATVEWYWDALYWARANKIAPFMKQLGRHVLTSNVNAMEWPTGIDFTEAGEGAASAKAHLSDKKGGDMVEFPTELQVREFPNVA